MNWPLSAFADEIDGSIDVQLKHLVEHQISLIDFRSVNGKNVMSLTDKEVSEVQAAASVKGVNFNCVGSPINKVTLEDGSADEELEKLHRAAEVAALLGTDRIRIFTPEGDDWAAVKAWMEPQVAFAKEKNLVLLHENDAKFFGAYPDKAKVLYAEFACDNFRAAYDFANPVHIGFYAMDDWFPWLLPYLETIHVKDFTNGKVVPAGDGDGQVREALIWLKKQNWEGVLSIEPHLQWAGDRGGFTGPESFGIATNSLKKLLGEL